MHTIGNPSPTLDVRALAVYRRVLEQDRNPDLLAAVGLNLLAAIEALNLAAKVPVSEG